MTQMMANVKDSLKEKASQAAHGVVDSVKDSGSGAKAKIEEAKQGLLRLRPLKKEEQDQVEQESDKPGPPLSEKQTKFLKEIDDLEQELADIELRTEDSE